MAAWLGVAGERPKIGTRTVRLLAARALRLGLVTLRGLNAMVVELESRLDPGEDPILHRQSVLRSTRRHDMAQHPDEGYYARQYWSWISENLATSGTPPSGRYLDLGCGQGRLSLLLARWCTAAAGRVVGVDLSETAIAQARAYAQQAGQSNVEYLAADAIEFARRQPDAEFDAVLLTEVLLFHPQTESLLRESVRVLRSGCLLFVSFRPQYFHALSLVRSRMWQDCHTILNQREARILGGESHQTWHTSAEVRRILAGTHGLEVLRLVAIGACSGIPGDPHASLARPSKLAADEQAHLMELERSLAHSVPDAGRYMLAIARKPR